MIDEARSWQAIQTRDANFDGQFYYGVRSTGVYCRPSCGSRQPRRANVAFFAQTVDAENAGFRACQRCRPNAAPPQSEIVQQACRLLEENAETGVSLTD